MTQAVGSIAFQTQQTSAVDRTAYLEFLAQKTAADAIKVTVNANLANGDRNIHEITIANPVTASVPDGAYYVVTIEGDGTTRTAVYKFETGQTAAQVSALLAAVADLHPACTCTVNATNTAKIDVITVKVGIPLTVTVDCRAEADNSQIAGAITAAEVTPESGSSTVRKLVEVTLDLGIKYSNNVAGQSPTPTLDCIVFWYNGSPTEPTASSPVTLPSTSPRTFAQIEAAT